MSTLYDAALWCPSPHFDQRPDEDDISLLVIHNISLPPGQFGSGDVVKFFQGLLDPNGHAFYEEIANMRVSAHCFVERTGNLVQFVDFKHRAWHAGVSSFQGRGACNNYSIGIELEGTDDIPYTQAQYDALVALTAEIVQRYPAITLGRIVGHNDIAPQRKTDPGVAFDWCKFRTMLAKLRD